MILDFHTHFYTEAYLNALERGDCAAQIERTADGQRRIAFAGDYSLVLPEHFQIERVAAAIIQRNPDDVLIDAGIRPGDRIVVEGLQRLRNGATVQIFGGKAEPEKVANAAGMAP